MREFVKVDLEHAVVVFVSVKKSSKMIVFKKWRSIDIAPKTKRREKAKKDKVKRSGINHK